MAKQHVSPIERHLEKAILILTGIIFLWALVGYLIMSPNKVDYGGQSYAPGELYLAIETQAQRTLDAMRRAEPSDDRIQDPATPIVDPRRKIRPSETDPRLKATFATSFVPPGLQVPDIKQTLSGDVVLAEVLPLSKPLLTQGKAMADLPPMEPREVGAATSSSGGRSTGIGFPAEVRWVSLWTFLNRRAQRDLFDKAGYDFGRQKIMVASVEVQRQEMQPDGTWGEPQSIQPYDPAPIRGMKREVPVRFIGGGTASVDEVDTSHIANIRRLIEERDGQRSVLRPPFQEFLMNDEWRWQPPAELAESSNGNIVWQLYDVRLFDLSDDALKRRPTRGGADGDRGAPTGIRFARETFAEAEKHLKNREFLKARDLLEEIENATDAGRYAVQARDLLRKHQQDFNQAQREYERELERRELAAKTYYGDDLDPVWINDTTVEPGKRYRYRVRPILFNTYAGAPALLKNPEAGGKVLIDGDWSAWSADILVQPDTYMFFTGADRQLRIANIHFHRWIAGVWEDTSGNFGIGDRITAERRNVTYEYDGVVADLDFNRPFSKRAEGAETVSFQETQTSALTLVSAAGQVEERLAEQDNMERSRLRDQIRNEETIERLLRSDPEALIEPPPDDIRIEGFRSQRRSFGQPGPRGPMEIRDARDRQQQRPPAGGRNRPSGASPRGDAPPS